MNSRSTADAVVLAVLLVLILFGISRCLASPADADNNKANEHNIDASPDSSDSNEDIDVNIRPDSPHSV